MITEDYCSHEVAKLLKEKGFDWICNGYYNKDDEESEPYFGDSEGADNWNNKAPSIKDLWCSAPTHQMAMKWLRDVYDIHISVNKSFLINDIDNKPYLVQVCTKKRHTSYNSWQEYHSTYEKAVEAALKYCLTELT